MIGRILTALGHLMAPRVCHICGCTLLADEEVLCLKCYLDLPRTGVHRQDFNIIHRRLGHHSVVDRAAGWFEYKKKSPYARLLVDAKYGGMSRMAYALGRMCADELSSEGFFDGIDILAPMPMHWYKRMRRGYNQAREICRGISDVTSIPIADSLRAVRGHGVQARHKLRERYTGIADTMAVVDDDELRGRHVLVVDDIITTGASVSEAIRAISQAAPRAVSVLALGLTTLDR